MYGKRKRIAAGASAMLSRVNRGKRSTRKPAGRAAKRPRLAVRTKTRFKRPSGRSRTKTATVASDGTARAHSGMETKTIRVGNFKQPKATTGAKWKYQQTYRYNLTSVAGQQGVNTLVVPCHQQKLFSSSGGSYTNIQNNTALEYMNPYINAIPTNTLGVYPGTAIPLNDRFIVNTCTLQIEFTNFTAVDAILDVYVVAAKKTTPDDPVGAWQKGLANQALGQVNMAQPTAATNTVNQGASTQGAPISSAVHIKPADSKLFSEQFKTCKVKRLSLTGGANEVLNVIIGVNKVIQREIMGEGSAYIKGVTYAVFTVQRGSLVEDNATGASASNLQLPTYGSTKVGCVIQEKYTLCGVLGNTTRLATNVEYSTIPYGATPSVEALLNVVDQGVFLVNALV